MHPAYEKPSLLKPWRSTEVKRDSGFIILNKRLKDLREPNLSNGSLWKWLAKRFQNFGPSGLPSHGHKLQRQAFKKLLQNMVHAVIIFKRPGAFLELQDGGKADYETHCTVGLVISFLRNAISKASLFHTDAGAD